MDTYKAYILKNAYERYQKIGDKLAKIEPIIDWEACARVLIRLQRQGWEA